MNILFFLQRRTKFIRDFYREASFPFNERKRKIEAGEEPFQPPYSEDPEYEDPEPAFLQEWMEADESLNVLRQMCISMLSSSLELYLMESIAEIHRKFTRESLAQAEIGWPKKGKKGWFNSHRKFFQEKLGIDWAKAPSDLSVLEEIVLTRNRAQHPYQISDPLQRTLRAPSETFLIYQSDSDAAKYPRSFFADESEMKLLEDAPELRDIFPPILLKQEEKFLAAVDEVDRFCVWLEDELMK